MIRGIRVTASGILAGALVFGGAAAACRAQGSTRTVRLSSLDLTKATQGWGKPQVDKNVRGTWPISVGGRKFDHGFGTHAPGALYVDLRGGCARFTAFVGVDDDVKGNPAASVTFQVVGDGRSLFRSGVMKAGQPAAKVDLDVKGMRTLALVVGAAGDGISFDNADWAGATFEVTGEQPETIDAPREEAVILTPRPPRPPRINGPKVFGVRPGSPFLFTIPATGERPMEFSARDLPAGLSLDPTNGRITGSVKEKGEYLITLRAQNALGTAERGFRIVVGDQLALTPPMGWNSWYTHFDKVTDQIMRAAADAMVSTGMINHGYAYVNIDDGWMVKPGSNDPLLGGRPRDANGMINACGKFPDMKAMTGYIHSKGLKAGLYTSPGPRTCAGYEGAYQHEEQDAKRFAEWGFDFLKYDWCSYDKIAKDKSLPELKKPYEGMNAALRKLDRDFIFNLCQYGMGDVWKWGAEVGGHCWRTAGDLGYAPGGLWGNVDRIGFSQNGLETYAGPGHWNDPDYLLIGHIGWKGAIRPTPLTPNEQYTHVSLWCLLASPLIFSGDMTKLDDFTLSLLTNDEVIDVDQDPLGRQGARVAQVEETEVWAKDMEDGSKAVGLFNRGEAEQKVVAKWSDLGLKGEHVVRDLWRQKDVGTFKDRFEATVPRHGVVLVRIKTGPRTQASRPG
jgi:alpha-galactosidase